MRGRRILVALLALCALPGWASGQVVLPWARPEAPTAPEAEAISESQLPLVRAHVEGGAAVWVGQAVVLNVEVIVPTWFTSAPVFPQLEVKNAVALSPEGAVNFIIQSGGKIFAAQSQSYLIYPQAEGTYTVQPLKVGVTYALPDEKPSPPKLLASPSIQFEARMPPGAEGAKYFLTADNFQITQSLSRKPDTLQIGDSVNRTVTMTAQNTVAISLPPLKFEAPEGIRAYAGVPKVLETAERGKIEATRTESVTYVPEKQGQYTLPDISILWWNPRTKTMNTASLPAVELKVQGSSSNPELFASSQGGEDSSGKAEAGLWKLVNPALRWTLSLLTAGFLFLVLWRALRLRGFSLGSYLAERRRRKAESEVTYFTQFRKASLADDPKAALRHLMRWLDRVNTGPTALTLRQFLTHSRMPELEDAIRELEDRLFAPQMQIRTGQVEARKRWSGTRLYALVAKARRHEKIRGRRQHRAVPFIQDINETEHRGGATREGCG